jgi:hypothetical protein
MVNRSKCASRSTRATQILFFYQTRPFKKKKKDKSGSLSEKENVKKRSGRRNEGVWKKIKRQKPYNARTHSNKPLSRVYPGCLYTYSEGTLSAHCTIIERNKVQVEKRERRNDDQHMVSRRQTSPKNVCQE